jgi:hypothetical protein|nr:MAG TPA_asm: hypothetical protein [Bacteriophage sp.]
MLNHEVLLAAGGGNTGASKGDCKHPFRIWY